MKQFPQIMVIQTRNQHQCSSSENMNIFCWKPNCLTRIYFNLFAQHKKCQRLMLTKDIFDTDLKQIERCSSRYSKNLCFYRKLSIALANLFKIKTFNLMPCSWIKIRSFTLIILDNQFNIGSQAFTDKKKYLTVCKRVS